MRIPHLLAALLALPLCVPAHADTFVSYIVSTDEDMSILGISSNGDLLVINEHDSPSSYDIFGPPTSFAPSHSPTAVLLSSSATMPAFTFDNGAPCSVPSGATPGGSAVCNGDREVYTGPDPTTNFFEIYPGSAPLGDVIYNGQEIPTPIIPADGFPYAVLNSNGDFAYVDQRNENIVEVLDITAPEPSSFVLLGTGLLGLAGVARLRFA